MRKKILSNCIFSTGNCLGAALQAALKLVGPTGGRVTVVNTALPTKGPGSLKPREDPNQRAAVKTIAHLGPATDFYKSLALECAGQQVRNLPGMVMMISKTKVAN